MVKADARTTVERPIPSNKLSEAEVRAVLDACHRPDTAHLPPTQIVPRLADEGVYLASEATFYRILKAEGMDARRGRAHPPRKVKLPSIHTATARWAAAGIQGTTIHATLVRNHGYTGSYSAVKRVLRRAVPVPPPESTMRLVFVPGEAAQVDFSAGPAMIDPVTGELRKTWFFVMTLCWSRHQYAEIVWNQTTTTWLACHRHAFKWFGGVPGRIIIDNAKCAITKACINDPTVQRTCAECAEGYLFKIDACPPHDSAKKVSWSLGCQRRFKTDTLFLRAAI